MQNSQPSIAGLSSTSENRSTSYQGNPYRPHLTHWPHWAKEPVPKQALSIRRGFLTQQDIMFKDHSNNYLQKNQTNDRRANHRPNVEKIKSMPQDDTDLIESIVTTKSTQSSLINTREDSRVVPRPAGCLASTNVKQNLITRSNISRFVPKTSRKHRLNQPLTSNIFETNNVKIDIEEENKNQRVSKNSKYDKVKSDKISHWCTSKNNSHEEIQNYNLDDNWKFNNDIYRNDEDDNDIDENDDDEYTILQNRVDNLSDEVTKLNNSFQKLRPFLEQNIMAKDYFEEKVSEIINSNHEEFKSTNLTISTVKSYASHISTMLSDRLDKVEQSNEELALKLSNLKETYDNVRSKFSDLSELKHQYIQLVASNDLINTRCEVLENSLATKNKEISNFQETIKSLQLRCDELEKTNEILKHMNQTKDIINELENC